MACGRMEPATLTIRRCREETREKSTYNCNTRLDAVPVDGLHVRMSPYVAIDERTVLARGDGPCAEATLECNIQHAHHDIHKLV